MQTEEIKALVVRYVEQVLNRGKLDLLNEICSPDYRRYVSPLSEPLTLDAQRQRLEAIFAAFPDWKLSIEEIICEGNVIAFRLIVRGTHKGTFLGLPATGKSFSTSALDIVRVDNGRFVEHWGGPDLFALTQQLGAKLVFGE
jgi:steroid delta-isomerase-like uncharacterized protein